MAADRALAEAAATRRAEVVAAEELAGEVRELIPRVLEARAARGYEAIAQVERPRKTLFGWKTETVGAYRVCEFEDTDRSGGASYRRPLWLASDGQLTPWDLDGIVAVIRDHPDAAFRREVHTTDALRKIAGGLRALL